MRLSRLAAVALSSAAVVSALGSLPVSASTANKSKVVVGDPYAKTDLKAPGAALTGAGSTFDQPFFFRAFYVYNQQDTGLTVNYASIGSGGGIQQFKANTVSFGATDVPMSSSDIAGASGGSVLQVPVALGGVSISYNVPGVKLGLKLTPDVLAGIFLGTVKTWNDSAIAKLNPKAKLPSQPITVVHRSDSSGTTYAFTNYLQQVSLPWSSGPGVSKSINWPTGVGESGNAGVAGFIQNTPYTIGYVELAYALQNHFTYAAIQNKAGAYVLPSLQSVQADAANKPQVTATNFPIVNEPGKASYPISTYSWALVYQTQKNATTGTALVDVLDWLTHAGQKSAKALKYVPLPTNIQKLARTALLQVVGPDRKQLLVK